MMVAWNVFSSCDLNMWTQQVIWLPAEDQKWISSLSHHIPISRVCRVWDGLFFSVWLWRCIFISNEKQCNGRFKMACEKIHSVPMQLKCLVNAHLCVILAQLTVTSRISKTASVRFDLDTFSALEIIYFTVSSHKNRFKIPAAYSSVASRVAIHEFLQAGSL